MRARLADFAAQAAALAQPRTKAEAGGGKPKPADAGADADSNAGAGAAADDDDVNSDGSDGGSGLEIKGASNRPSTGSEQPPQNSGSTVGATVDVADAGADVTVAGADAEADFGGVDAAGAAEAPEETTDLSAEGGGDEGDELGGSGAALGVAERSVAADADAAHIESHEEDSSSGAAQAQASAGGGEDSSGVNHVDGLELEDGVVEENVAVGQEDGAAFVDV